MKKLLLFILITITLYSNDGAYTLSGNQLVPINESNISVKKEILTITRLDKGILDVKVEYTFFNPNKEKTIVVGFEAAEPEGDVETEPINGGHPYMKSFSVVMNGKKLDFKINDNVKKENIAYVYYFNAPFKRGVNKVIHHYTFEHSSGAGLAYEFDYVLSAASRWAGEVIEDFTLIIDNGDKSEFQIVKSFFKNANEWKVDGLMVDCFSDFYNKKPALQFYIRKSPIVFKKKNFKIEGELYLISELYSKKEFPSKIVLKILRNLPYAKRGYVFKSHELNSFFMAQPWYKKRPQYKAKYETLEKNEQEWINKVKAMKRSKVIDFYALFDEYDMLVKSRNLK